MDHPAAPPGASPATLRARVASAAGFLPLLLIVWAGSIWFALLVTGAALLGLWEFYRLAQRAGAHPTRLLGLAWTAALVATAYFSGPAAVLPAATTGALAILLWIVARRQVKGALSDWAFSVAGPFYLGVTLLHAVLLRQGPSGLEWMLVALAGTFATDTGAYFTGRALGRHSLAPTISPGKTWEGAAGGLAWAVAATTLVAWPLGLPLSVWQAVFLGAAIGIVAQLGDLAESLMKRAVGAKEAGQLIPGHGGILDRLDSLVFTLVLVYYVARGIAL